MSKTNQDIERLIVRQLDTELSEDEQLELNRELIRDPEAHQLLQDYQRIDSLAAAALGEALGKGDVGFDPAALLTDRAPRRVRHLHRGWWLAIGAVAAALLALMIPQSVLEPADQAAPAIVDSGASGLQPNVALDPLSNRRQAPMRTVGTSSPTRIRRDTGRDVVGVVGDDGNIYWIEIDRTRTYKRPPRQSGRRGTGGGI